jgi:hypothetical protein
MGGIVPEAQFGKWPDLFGKPRTNARDALAEPAELQAFAADARPLDG